MGTPKGTHRDDGEARVRDARRGGGRAELRAGEGSGKGKPRHVEKTRHSSSGVLRTRVRAQVPQHASPRRGLHFFYPFAFTYGIL